MIDRNEISNLIYLLDDTDREVIEQIEGRILSLGTEVIEFLESASEQENDNIRLARLRDLIRKLKKDEVLKELLQWRRSDEQDLLEGMIILEKVEFPFVDKQKINQLIDKIKLDAWLELNYDLTSFEQVKILNYIFFNLHKFKGNTDSYHDSHNSFLSKVLENKTGNPISMAIVYSLIAQRLNIPIYGVNLPQHFVLGYRSEEGLEIIKRFNDPGLVGAHDGGDVMFYINPFSEGLILNHESLKSFLEQLHIEPKEEFFSVCTNLDIIRRVLRNLLYSYERVHDNEKALLVQKLITAMA
ncbi:MAG: hypothetical protein GC181_09905 [Bacteroidetes bacterium]|nr:hypothetical protein [Bacteroidota bacterium]